MEKKVITKDTLIIDVVNINPDSVAILQSYGMHCLGCAFAHQETVEQAVKYSAYSVSVALVTSSVSAL